MPYGLSEKYYLKLNNVNGKYPKITSMVLGTLLMVSILVVIYAVAWFAYFVIIGSKLGMGILGTVLFLGVCYFIGTALKIGIGLK